MKMEGFKTYAELPEEDKNKCKPINEKGDFVEKTAIEDPGVAHRIAVLENEAFGELEDNVAKSKLSIEGILKKLNDNKLKYDEKSKLQDMLFRIADLERLKGNPIDDQIEEGLKKTYSSIKYSKILSDKLIEGVAKGDAEVVGELLKDQKLGSEWQLMYKLINDEQRQKAFEFCKERIKGACAVIEKMEDVNLGLKMYQEIVPLSDKKSYSDNSDLESAGRKLANKLHENGAKEQLVNLVEEDIFKLAYFKDFLHTFGSEPEFIAELAKRSDSVDDISYALKFVADSEILESLKSDIDSFAKLEEEGKAKLSEYLKVISGAAKNPAETIALTELKEDKYDMNFRSEVPQNKFVVGIQGAKYVIAWSNMETHEYHRNIFESIGHTMVKSGGYMGKVEKNGKLTITMRRKSGDYGFYSKELLEKNREILAKSLQEIMGEKEFDLVIMGSTEY
jgi:hypothetical protein